MCFTNQELYNDYTALSIIHYFLKYMPFIIDNCIFLYEMTTDVLAGELFPSFSYKYDSKLPFLLLKLDILLMLIDSDFFHVPWVYRFIYSFMIKRLKNWDSIVNVQKILFSKDPLWKLCEWHKTLFIHLSFHSFLIQYYFVYNCNSLSIISWKTHIIPVIVASFWNGK